MIGAQTSRLRNAGRETRTVKHMEVNIKDK